MLRALPWIPGHLKAAFEELLTPTNIALFVGITVVLMASGVGEVLGLGLLAVGLVAGGLDLCTQVLRMIFDFYRQATRATSERELDQAAELFAQIILRGGVDLLDILVGRRAAAKLAGPGLRSVGAYFGYLEKEMQLWRARQGGSGVRPTVKQDPPPSTMNNAQKGVYGEHASDAHMYNKGYTKLNDGGTLTPSTGGARGTGIDGVWRNPTPPPEYIITEAKYGSSRLGDTADGRQMSDTWILGSNRLERAVGQQEANKIRRAMAAGRVERQVHQIDASGNITVTTLP